MGTDKALVKIGSETMIQRVVRALHRAQLEPIRIAVARPQDVESYGMVIRGGPEIEWVLDGNPHSGPIDAIVECLQDPGLGNEDTLQLAPVDCPWVTEELFISLRKGLGPDDSLIMPHDGERPQPLLALLRPSLILEKIVEDRRPLHKQFAECSHSIMMVEPSILRNVNHATDLE